MVVLGRKNNCKMEFSPNNRVVQSCLQGIIMEEMNKPQEASEIFLRAWMEGGNDFEKFLAAYYVARHQKSTLAELRWLEASLQFALKINDVAVQSAYPILYLKIAQCYEDLKDLANAKKNRDLANSFSITPSDKGPFFHGTKADLHVGDLLTPGGDSNYKAELKMNHIYFTALVNGAGLAAALAKGNGVERVYVVEPMGDFQNDPNVTDKKFPGNLTRSYRSESPLKIIGEMMDWVKQTPEGIQEWKEKLANNKGEIIN